MRGWTLVVGAVILGALAGFAVALLRPRRVERPAVGAGPTTG